jgi:alpha-mannosidase
LPAPELAEVGPLCTRLVWRGMCGASPLRLDVQLRAASPWLELVLQVDWRQRHELLRLELPLAQRACRYAADGPGGVWERPAQPLNPREKARWEVPVVSWMASQVAGGGGLAVLLDGPQGVSATEERLGVSLLRAPTWPDPSADEGRQRLRVALMPCLQGWRQQAVPLQAQLFREPMWLAPAAGEVPSPRWSALSFGAEALQMVHLQPIEGTASALLVLQNLSPTRQRVSWPPGVCAQRQLAASEAVPQDADGLAPWQIGRWRISALPHQSS